MLALLLAAAWVVGCITIERVEVFPNVHFDPLNRNSDIAEELPDEDVEAVIEQQLGVKLKEGTFHD